MADETTVGPGEPESPVASEPSNAEEFFAQVHEDLVKDDGDEQAEAPTEPEAAAEPAKAQDPDSIAWLKKVQGNAREDGTLDLNRVADQAYNLNKQNQEQARRISEIERVLKNPIVAAALERVSRGEDAAPVKEEPKKPDAEKTDEEVIAEFVDARYKPHIEKLEQTINVLIADKVKGEILGAVAKIKEEFGVEEYAAQAPSVQELLEDAAREVGMPMPELVRRLALADKLHKTLRSAMVNVTYPKLQEKVKGVAKVAAETAESDKRKSEAAERAIKAQLPRKGTTAGKVSAPQKVESWEDAVALAETELAQAQ